MTSLDANLQFHPLPYDNFSPYLYGGGGYIYDFVKTDTELNESFFKIQWGIGLQYYLNNRWSLQAFAEQNWAFSDELDNVINGKRNDIYYNFGLGLKYYFNF